MLSRIRKWADKSSERKVNVVATVLALIMLGCYAYLGFLLTKLFGGV